MAGATSYELIVACPECRRGNRLVSDMIPDDQQLRCSYCAAVVGVWGDLKRTAKQSDWVANGNGSTRIGGARRL